MFYHNLAVIDGDRSMEHDVSQTSVHSHSLCIAPGQGKFNLVPITSKPRKVVMGKKNPQLLTNMKVLFT